MINMKIIIAPDSFKGSASALEVANAIKEGVQRVFSHAQLEIIPMADGGEGTVQSLIDATGGKILVERVVGPLENEVEAIYGILGDNRTAVIEMAQASGLTHVAPEERNPCITTTYGTGQLIKAALDYGCRKLIIGIGGSATNDGGAGMAEALGVKLLDSNGHEIQRGGGSLDSLDKIDISGIDPRLNSTEIIVACDVNNPLNGKDGASNIYGPQKGATPDMILKLDRNLFHFSTILQRDLNINKIVANIPGSGAAGGLGAGLIAFLNAELRSGIDIIIDATDFKNRIKDANIIITGEGRIDSQTIFGKTPIGIAKLAKSYNIPVIAIAGGISDGAEKVFSFGIDAIIDIVAEPMSLNYAMSNAISLISNAAEYTARLIATGMSIR